MLIIIITAAILGIGIVLLVTDWNDLCDYISRWLIMIGGIFLACELIALLGIHLSAPIDLAKLEMRYESLTYQYDNDLYDNDNDVGKKELMKEIQEWNEDLAGYKRGAHSPLVGWFIPDEFANFDYIELKGAGK